MEGVLDVQVCSGLCKKTYKIIVKLPKKNKYVIILCTKDLIRRKVRRKIVSLH